MIFVKNESLKKKVLCSVLAASVFGVMYAGDVQAASINGKDVGSVITDEVILKEAGSAKFVMGKGEKVEIKTNANVNAMIEEVRQGIESGKSKFEALYDAITPGGVGDVPVVGVVGGHGMIDKEFASALALAKNFGSIVGLKPNQTALLDKVLHINTVEHPEGEQLVNINGGTNVVIGDADHSPVVMGVVGGDMLLNTSLKYGLGSGNPTDGTSKIDINRIGNVELTINNGNVIGALGGSAAVGLGNINANFKIPVFKELKAEFTGKEANTTIDGNIITTIKDGANVAGLMNGGAAVALGGDSTSIVTGDSNVIIDSKVNFTDAKDGVTGVITGGGVAMTTFGGTATSDVQGDANISINNGLTGFVAGGGVAAAVDATGVAEAVIDPQKQYGHDKGHVDIEDEQLEKLLGKDGGIPDGTIVIDNAVQGGTATSKIGNTNITLTGTTTAAGILGGGIAVSSHTYTWKGDGTNTEEKDKYTFNDSYGKSVATAESGKTTINVNLDSTNLDKDKLVQAVKDLKGAMSELKAGHEFDALNKGLEALGKAEDQGAALGVIGGGMAIAQGSSRTNLNDKGLNDQGAFSTATNKGAEINLVKGYVVGTLGGGVAGAINNSTAKAETTEDIVINVYKDAEAIGVAGNGLAYFTGKSEGGTKHLAGTATVTAKNTAINLAGKADGVIGGGIAIDDSQADTTNAIVKTEGTSTITVYDGAEISKLNFDPLVSLAGNAPENGIDMGSYVAAVKDAAQNIAIAGGGVAIGGGAESTVKESVINVAGGTVTGDIVAGGVAVYGYGDKGGSTVEKSTINLNAGKVDGNVFAGGSASKITTGSAGYDQAKATVGESTINLNGAEVTGFISGLGVSGGDNDKATNSTLNVIGNNTLAALKDGGSKIVGFNNINFAADSVTTITGLTAGSDKAFIDAKGGKINVDQGAKLDVSQLTKAEDAYFVAGDYAADSTLWKDSQLAYDRTEGFAKVDKTEDGKYNVIYKGLDKLTEEEEDYAINMFMDSLGDYGDQVQGIVEGIVTDGENTNEGAKDFFGDLTSGTGDATADLKTGMLFGEAAGVTSNSISMATDFADNAALRLSFTQDKVTGENKVAEEGGVWAKYIHNKHEVNGASSSMGGLSSSNDYDGVMVGAELAKKGDYQYGIAFAYGDGDGSGMGVENDFDTWGVNLYSNLKKDDVNIIADLGYSKTSNELTGKVEKGTLTADRDVNILTAGVRAEKLYVNGNTQVVPYIGLRYFNIDGDSYTSYYNGKAAFQNEADSQNVWTLPVGVSLRNETVTKSGWRVTPKIDLAYIFAFGDTDNTVNVSAGSGMSTMSYDVMDSSSWLASAALEAGKGDWSYGVGYSYQKGSDVENNKWFVNVNYSF